MLEVPALTPVTTPALVTVATVVLEEIYGVVAFGVPLPVMVTVEPMQTDAAAKVGNGLTISVAHTCGRQPAAAGKGAKVAQI